MGELLLRHYRHGDEDAFTPRADFAAERRAVNWDWRSGPPGPTWTLLRWTSLDDFEVMGVGGYVETLPRSWEAWAWTAELSAREWAQAARLTGSTLRAMLREAPATTRIYAAARAAMPSAIRLLQRLGFEIVEAQCYDPRLPHVPLVQLMRAA